MAKFTELFGEYIADGGALPSAFSEIEGFSNLFKGYFCDKEIGFETEQLFQIKLETYANIYIPIYKQRIEDLALAITGARNPARTYYEKYNTTIDAGEQSAQTTDLPIDAATAEPSSTTHSDSYQNKDERITNREEKGLTYQDAYMVIDNLNKSVNPLIYRLLREFDRIFMQVY